MLNQEKIEGGVIEDRSEGGLDNSSMKAEGALEKNRAEQRVEAREQSLEKLPEREDLLKKKKLDSELSQGQKQRVSQAVDELEKIQDAEEQVAKLKQVALKEGPYVAIAAAEKLGVYQLDKTQGEMSKDDFFEQLFRAGKVDKL